MTDLLAVLGPTATGKTKLAVSLAQRFGGEVVSCDSMQVYRGMDIGTAKPSLAETAGVPHHLLSIVGPAEPFSVAEYAARARRAVDDIVCAGKLPILAGGTGLYADAVMDGLRFDDRAPADPALRAALREQARSGGGEGLLEALRAVDPESAAKLHPNNLGRIIRALEVYRLTGRPISAAVAESRRRPPPFKLCVLGLFCSDRAALYAHIDARVDDMFANGLEREVKTLLASGVPEGATSMQAIGYKETAAYLAGRLTREEAVSAVKLATRRYAKRQMTWFRRDPRIRWIDICGRRPDNIYQEACEIVEKVGYVCYTIN